MVPAESRRDPGPVGRTPVVRRIHVQPTTADHAHNPVLRANGIYLIVMGVCPVPVIHPFPWEAGHILHAVGWVLENVFPLCFGRQAICHAFPLAQPLAEGHRIVPTHSLHIPGSRVARVELLILLHGHFCVLDVKRLADRHLVDGLLIPVAVVMPHREGARLDADELHPEGVSPGLCRCSRGRWAAAPRQRSPDHQGDNQHADE